MRIIVFLSQRNAHRIIRIRPSAVNRPAHFPEPGIPSVVIWPRTTEICASSRIVCPENIPPVPKFYRSKRLVRGSIVFWVGNSGGFEPLSVRAGNSDFANGREVIGGVGVVVDIIVATVRDSGDVDGGAILRDCATVGDVFLQKTWFKTP